MGHIGGMDELLCHHQGASIRRAGAAGRLAAALVDAMDEAGYELVGASR